MLFVYLGAILLCSILWVLGVFLYWDFLFILLLNLGIGLVVLVAWFIARKRAASAAEALERQIMSGAATQMANTRPDRRGEIEAMRDEMQKGFAVLRDHKDGGRALATIPWYAIIGPPGAGKSTALRQSGLDFPMQREGKSATRGVGGTRNCEWWFSNEAVLLDTAGRWTVEQDDREEWLAFLDMLKKFRPSAPINGVIVAVSVSDLVSQSEEQLEELAKAIRARIDEMMVRLAIVVPVYVMITKVDLVAGFVEFFGDLKKSERGRVFGATFRLDADRREPAAMVGREIDLLLQAAHARAIVRLAAERDFSARPRILQFPLELKLLRDPVSYFTGVLMRPNAYQETPILRGFYLTSGTQEGRPLDRVIGGMMQAFGLAAPPGPTNQAAQYVAPGTQVEHKSYFVTDVFRKVAFGDKGVASRRKFRKTL